jgi:hypothetical protein
MSCSYKGAAYIQTYRTVARTAPPRAPLGYRKALDTASLTAKRGAPYLCGCNTHIRLKEVSQRVLCGVV